MHVIGDTPNRISWRSDGGFRRLDYERDEKKYPKPVMIFSKHFLLEELVPKDIFESFGQKSIWFIDPRLVRLADFVREFFHSPVTINNWHIGGQFQNRGFRHPDSTTGGKLSQHKFGRAMDINVKGHTPQQVYDFIISNEKQFMNAGLTTLEDSQFTSGWTHLDIRWTGINFIQIVKP